MTRNFINLLKADNIQKNILVTIVPNATIAREYINRSLDLWKCPSAIRLSNKFISHQDYDFSPGLINFPDYEEAISPLTRTSTDNTLNFSILRDTPLNIDFRDETTKIMLPVQADVLPDGSAISEKFFLGMCEISYNNYNDNFECRAVDSLPNKDLQFPAISETLNRDSFPQMPYNVVGKYSRKIQIGDFDYPLTCPVVNNGTLFYVCDHKLSVPPSQVEVDGVKLAPNKWSLEEHSTNIVLDPRISSNIMTMIRIGERQDSSITYITCRGGVGLKPNVNPPIFLLEKYGRIKLSTETRNIFSMSDFNMSIQVENSENIFTIMNDRIMPQTNYFMGSRLGAIEVYGVGGRQTSVKLAIGAGLIGRTTDAIEFSDASNIYNSIQVTYARNPFSQFNTDSGSNKFILTKENAPTVLKEKLYRSVEKYGNRMLKFDMPDIINRVSARGVTPSQVYNVAYQTLMLSSERRKSWSYYVTWDSGFKLKLNDIVKISDPHENLVDQNARIVSRKFTPSCLILKFMEE